jgi:hypothetical protein
LVTGRRRGDRHRVRRLPPKNRLLYEVERHLPSTRLVRIGWLNARATRERMFEGRPRLERGFLPGVALALAATLALTAWQLAPDHDSQGEHIGVTDGQPSAGGQAAATPGAGPAAPGASAGGVSPGQARPTVPRVAPADTDGPFPSGVAAGSMTEVRRWVEFRDRPVDVVVTYAARSSWRGITRPWLGADADHFRDFAGDWVISQPLFPDEGPEKGNLADCAAGEYNGHWRTFGRWLVAQGRADSFVRLGWEFNGLWFAWAATDAEQWKQCFRNASSAIKGASPQVRIDWCINAHGSTTPADAFELYPGDEYVDVIGIDSYDMYPPSPDIASFVKQCNGPDGLCRVIAFARARNKLFSVPEWGLVGLQGTRAGAVGQAGGDSPVYIREMHRVFMENADILAYEAYFNDDVSGNVHSSLNNPNRHPISSEVYRQLW